MKPVHKGMLATFFGVLFGSLVALAVQQVWVLGAFVGGIASAGLSAYVLFDAKEFLAAIPKAWSRAIHWRPSEDAIGIWKLLGLLAFLGCVSTLTWLPVLLLKLSVTKDDLGLLFGVMTMASLLGLVCRVSPTREFLFKWQTAIIIWRDVPVSIVWLSPLVVFAILRSMPAMVRWTFRTALPAVGRFAKELFILIHCRDRAMCMVDASLGMVAAFLVQQQFMGGGPLLSVGSILVGGFAGTVLFFFNREVVAIRWLKVHPNGIHA